MTSRPRRAVRYAVVGLGQIAQVAVRIRKNREPEPSGAEGLQDIRIVHALYESAETGQRIRRPGIREPELVHAKSAST